MVEKLTDYKNNRFFIIDRVKNFSKIQVDNVGLDIFVERLSDSV